MAWKNTVAHKLTIGYLKRRYKLDSCFLLKNPAIEEMPFYGEPPYRHVEAAIFAGELTRFLASMDFPLEDGKDLNGVFNSFVTAAENPNEKISTVGAVVDDHFRFLDDGTSR